MHGMKRSFSLGVVWCVAVGCSITIEGTGETRLCLSDVDCPAAHYCATTHVCEVCTESSCGTGGAGASSGAGTGGQGGTSGSSAGEADGHAGEGTTTAGGTTGAEAGATGEAGADDGGGESGAAGAGAGAGMGGGGNAPDVPSGAECVHVAPTGDDEAAVASGGDLPFGSLQAAVDFATSRLDVPQRVCVAAGPQCGAVATFADGRGDLYLRSSISIFGRYESTAFSRCSDSETRLLPSAGGVWISDVPTGLVLDGLTIRSADAPTATALVITRSTNIELNDLKIQDSSSQHSTGIVASDAEFSLTDSRVELRSGTIGATGVAPHRSQIRAVGNTIDISGVGKMRGVFFDSAGASVFSDNTIRVDTVPEQSAVGVSVYGFNDGLKIHSNSLLVLGGVSFDSVTIGISLDDCSFTRVAIEDNTLTVEGKGQLFPNESFGIRSRSLCPTRIHRNQVSTAAASGQASTAIHCSVGGCAISENEVSTRSFGALPGSVNRGTGIYCSDCVTVARNRVTGLTSLEPCDGTCDFNSIGIHAEGQGTTIDSNRVDGGCSGGPIGGEGSAGIRASGSIRITNNFVEGGHECERPVGAALTSGILVTGGDVDIHSNFIHGGDPSTSICTSAGVRLWDANRATLRNNIIEAGGCQSDGAPIQVSDPRAYPALIEANDLLPNTSGVLYRDVVFRRYYTLAEVDAVSAFPFRGSFSAECALPLQAGAPCVDRGVQALAPAFDFDNDSRDDGSPDVGPDELRRIGFAQVTAGDTHTCGLLTDGTLRCWGFEEFFWGQHAPVGDTFLAVDAGVRHTCAIRSNATLVCWGNLTYSPNYEIMSALPSGEFKAISVGTGHDCGVRIDGTVACWGLGYAGQTNVPGGAFEQVEVGDTHVCGLRTDGRIECWGSNAWGEAAPPPGEFTAVSANAQHSCGLRPNGRIECWGRLDLQDMQPPPPEPFVSVQSGWANFQCGMRPTGEIACWGNNSLGQVSPPAGVFVAFSSGMAHSCALRSDGTLACWGRNDYGQSTPH